MRLQIDTIPAQDELMDRLMELAGITSKKELFNNALTFFAWGLAEAAKGRNIASVDEANGKYQELQMPALMTAAMIAEGKGKKTALEIQRKVADAA